MPKCPCGNTIGHDEVLCEWCECEAAQPPHTGHFSTFGTYWCDTCNSPLCNLI